MYESIEKEAVISWNLEITAVEQTVVRLCTALTAGVNRLRVSGKQHAVSMPT